MGEARVGKILGNFRILECLGSGGAGMIWKAEDLTLGRVVALKALRAELAADAEMSQRFRDEARTLAKLAHANVASLYSLIEDDDGGVFLVLEYVEGSTLAALLATSGPLPLDVAFALFHQVLDGVGHAHEAGVVHRDLKPANLMADARGRIKVMDFGIARVAGAARTTHHGKLIGTPEYMSPEQVRGEDATIRSDIYSLGILLFEMLTGQPPFRATASFELMRSQIEDAPPDPRAFRPELDPRIAGAILRALAKRPTDRFATTRELQDALLAAGASRRGRPIGPVWRDLPPPVDDSEAPTLSHEDAKLAASQRAERAAVTPADGKRAHVDAGEQPDAWSKAVDALDQDIDAAFVDGAESLEGAPHEGAASRAEAPTTVVIDATEDTARIESARPTRMIDAAPFALSAHSLRSAPASGPGASAFEGKRGLLWIAVGATLVALAFGAVRLRQDDAQDAPGNAPQREKVVREPAPPPARSAEIAPVVNAPEAQPANAADRKSASAERPRRARSAKASRPKPAPQPRPPEDAGWVIRR